MKRARVWILLAWLIHAVAWFVPVTTDVGWDGWQPPGLFAFRMALMPFWPFLPGQYSYDWQSIFMNLSAVSTIWFILVSPWVVWRGSRRMKLVNAWIAAFFAVNNSCWLVLGSASDRASYRAGYYLWWASFAVLAAGLFALARQEKAKAVGTTDEH